MSDDPNKPKTIHFFLVGLTQEQRESIQADADIRYPERHGPTQIRRNFSPQLRDIVDFWRDHKPLFASWIAARNNLPPQA